MSREICKKTQSIPNAAFPDAAFHDAAISYAAISDATIHDAVIPNAAVPDTAILDAASVISTKPFVPPLQNQYRELSNFTFYSIVLGSCVSASAVAKL